MADAKAACDKDNETLEQALAKRLEVIEGQRTSAAIEAAGADAVQPGTTVASAPAEAPDRPIEQPTPATAAAIPEQTATQPAAPVEATPPIATPTNPATETASAGTPSPPAASTNTAAAADNSQLLSYRRMRDTILRKPVSGQHAETISGYGSITEFRVVGAIPDDSDAELVNLATKYAIARTGLADAGTNLSREPVRYQRTITVNNSTETVVRVGQAERVN